VASENELTQSIRPKSEIFGTGGGQSDPEVTRRAGTVALSFFRSGRDLACLATDLRDQTRHNKARLPVLSKLRSESREHQVPLLSLTSLAPSVDAPSTGSDCPEHHHR
jgi:hypothetical protein